MPDDDRIVRAIHQACGDAAKWEALVEQRDAFRDRRVLVEVCARTSLGHRQNASRGEDELSPKIYRKQPAARPEEGLAEDLVRRDETKPAQVSLDRGVIAHVLSDQTGAGLAAGRRYQHIVHEGAGPRHIDRFPRGERSQDAPTLRVCRERRHDEPVARRVRCEEIADGCLMRARTGAGAELERHDGVKAKPGARADEKALEETEPTRVAQCTDVYVGVEREDVAHTSSRLRHALPSPGRGRREHVGEPA